MKLRKVLSISVIAALMLGIAGCGPKTKKYTDILDDMDFEAVEYKEFKDCEEEEGDFEDGLYVVTTEEKEIRKLFKNTEFDIDPDDVVSAVFAQQSVVDSEDNMSNFGAYVISFANADAAEDCFDDMVDQMEDALEAFESFESFGDIDQDDDDGMYIYAADFNIAGNIMSVRMGCYLDGKDVIGVLTVAYMGDADDFCDLVDDFCDALGYELPGDLL